MQEVPEEAEFWVRYAQQSLNARQVKVLNRLLDHFEGKLTTPKWAKLAKCSQDTAHRDVLGLVARGAWRKDSRGGRIASYSLVIGNDDAGDHAGIGLSLIHI